MDHSRKRAKSRGGVGLALVERMPNGGNVVSCRALVVDDDADVAREIGRTMLRWDIRYDVARDAATALTRLSITRYAIVIVDLGLPGGSSRELLRATIRERRGTPTLVISAAVTDVEALRGLGVAGVLHKPVDFALLTDLLRGVRAAA